MANSSQIIIPDLEVKIMRMQRSIAVQHRWNPKVWEHRVRWLGG